jgi:peptidoglycan-N-acetylglucosamine deacetylase
MRKCVAALLLLTFACACARAADQKLIALTFDDGPRPYVLYGMRPAGTPPALGLLDLLDQQQVKATFFVMGWRLTPGTHGDPREFRTDKTCLDAARDVFRHGHEIEDHSYSHVQFRLFAKKHGDAGVVADVDRASELIKGLTGRRAAFVRPPDWITWKELDRQLQGRGYRVMNISAENPPALRDINTVDYLCVGEHPVKCPKPSLGGFVLQQIEQRERHGVYTHILTFHELSTTVAALKTLLPDLKARGYRFVTLEEYMRAVK